MVGTTKLRILSASSLASLALTFFPSFAFAQITEPDGFGPVPVDPRAQCSKTSGTTPNPNGTIGCTGTADIGDFNCCNNTLDNMSLIGLFKYWESDTAGNVLIDFQKDAKTEPATFNPLCSIQGNMVMHGGGCQVGFGWYCVDETKSYSNPPTIYPLISAADIQTYAADPGNVFPTAWKNNDGAFLPKTSYAIAGKKLSDLASDPNFKACASKKIGFAVIGGTAPGGAGVCTQNKYTESRLNQIHTASGKPYVTAVMYASKNYPGRFYIGVEDLPTSPTQFNAAVPGKTWTADGDFNDFVYTVEGVVCQGGGQLCSVPGKTGLCATGVTSCVTAPGATASCDPVFQPQTETCNAIDDDCDGTIDNGDTLCPAAEFCFRGTCVHECQNTGEFTCPAGQTCVNKYCVESSCANVTCNADQKCVAGVCVGGCSDVKCTAGQQCVAGKCVDLCDARQQAKLADCPDNFVCQNGACVPNCTCLPCPDPTTQECQSNASAPGFGRCVASGCSNVTCSAGQLCIPGGTCIDPCASNSCGANQTCKPNTAYDSTNPNQQYSCNNPDGTASTGGSGTGTGTSVCLGPNCGQGNSGNSNSGVGGNGAVTHPPASSSGAAGCGCRVAPGSMGAWAAAGLAGLALLVVRRRRR